jgi:hypothetical protein
MQTWEKVVSATGFRHRFSAAKCETPHADLGKEAEGGSRPGAGPARARHRLAMASGALERPDDPLAWRFPTTENSVEKSEIARYWSFSNVEDPASNTAPLIHRTGAPGRPTSMHLIEVE